MKKLIAICMLLPTLALAGTWTTVKKGSLFILEDRDNKDRFIQLQHSGTAPRITAVNRKYPGLELIEYNAGDSGTSLVINTTRRVIFDSVNKKFLGDHPYQYKIVGESDKVAESPVWKIDTKKKEITIKSEAEDIDLTIKY